VWAKSTHFIKIKKSWDGTSLSDSIASWTKEKSISKKLVALTCWFIFLERNKVIFYEKEPSVWVVVYKILGSLNISPSPQKSIALRTCPITQFDGYAIACFDGASISGGLICGAEGVIKLPESTVYKWFINCGNGTNTKAELMGHFHSSKALKYTKDTVNGGLKGCC
jgi:hypothetical protein